MLDATLLWIMWICFCYALLGILLNIAFVSTFKKKNKQELAASSDFPSLVYLAIIVLILLQFVFNLLGTFSVFVEFLFGLQELESGFLVLGTDFEEIFGWEIALTSLCCVIIVAMYSYFIKNVLKVRRNLYDARLEFYGGTSSNNQDNFDNEEVDQIETITSTEPATLEDVIIALDRQLKSALKEADDLKFELSETKEKVAFLESEIKTKDLKVRDIKKSKQNFNEAIEKQKLTSFEQGDKSLSLRDSVAVGDTIVGGMKIDKQIHNDAESIARAVIAAYKEGQKDSD
jgi:hypothetical protein